MRGRLPRAALAGVVTAALLLSACAPTAAPTPFAGGSPSGARTTRADWSRLTGFEVLTQYSPSSTFVGQATDLGRIARSFTGILLASGKLGPSREQSVQLASALKLHVWLDVDLSGDFAKGKRITPALEALAAFANKHRTVVVGMKLANELGQDDPYAHDPGLLERYLQTVGAVLHSEAPGVPVTVDMPVPEAPCQPGAPGLIATGGSAACLARTTSTFPALRQRWIDHYLSLGVLDGLFVTPYLKQDEAYTAAGTDTADVLRFCYRWLGSRPWAGNVRLFSRKALAFPDQRYPGNAQDAELDVERHLQVPQAAGLSGADIWAWHRPFRGQLRTLMDKDGSANLLWDQLVSFRSTLGPLRKPETVASRTPRPPAASEG
jgi:hypothetical protein